MTTTNSFHVDDTTFTTSVSDITEYTFTITLKDVVPLSQMYWAFSMNFANSGNTDTYTGLQPISNLAGGGTAPALNFAVWNASTANPGVGSSAGSFFETTSGMRITHAEPVATGVSYTIDLKITDGQLVETETDQSGNSIVIGSIPAQAATFAGTLDYFSEYYGEQVSTAYPLGEVQFSNVLVNGQANQLQYGATYLSSNNLTDGNPCIYAGGPDGYYDSSTGPTGANLTLHLQSENATVGGGANLNTVVIGAGFNDLTGDIFYNIQQIDGGGQTLTLNAAETALHMAFRNASLTVSDTAEDVATYLDSLQALVAAGQLSSITLTDGGTPTLQLTAAEETNDAAALRAIVSPYHLTTVSTRPDIVSMSAISANETQTITFSGSGFGTQAAYTGSSLSIKINDMTSDWQGGWGGDWITLAVASWTDNTITLSGFAGQYGSVYGMLHAGDQLAITIWNPQNGIQSQTEYITVSTGGETVDQAVQAYQAGTATSATPVADNAADVQANLSSLQAMAVAGLLGSVTLTDFGSPNLALTAAQLTADSAALADITSEYTLTVSGVSAASAAAVAQQAHVLSIAVADSGANLSANLDSLNALVVAGNISSIATTDSGVATLSVSAAQLSSDAAALKAISGTFQVTIDASLPNLTIDGVSGHGNTVVFSGAADQYTITPGTDGLSLTVASGSSTDDLSNVAALQFSDVTDIVAATPGNGVVTTGNITELYGAVFGRLPDVAGLAFYQNYLTANPSTPLVQFAEFFLASPEYTSTHSYAQSTVGDDQFITDSYENLLHRAPDTGALPYYEKVIDQFTQGLIPGTAAYAAAQTIGHAWVLTYFSASPEFLGDVQVTAQTPSSAQHWLILI